MILYTLKPFQTFSQIDGFSSRDEMLTGNMTWGQSEPGSNSNKRVIPYSPELEHHYNDTTL